MAVITGTNNPETLQGGALNDTNRMTQFGPGAAQIDQARTGNVQMQVVAADGPDGDLVDRWTHAVDQSTGKGQAKSPRITHRDHQSQSLD